MNSVSTITLSTSNSYNNKQTTNSKHNDGLLLSASVALVKTQLYQCWLQVYGPLFWIVSAMICLYSSNSNNTTSTTSTPGPPVLRYYSYYPQNHHEVNVLQVRQGQQKKCYNNEDRDYYDEGEKNDNNIIDDAASPPSTLRVRHGKQVDGLKLEALTAPQPKKSLRRSLKLHMQSFKGSLNQVVRRSTTRLQRNKNHSNDYSNDINTYYHNDNNNNNINNESIVIHPPDFGLQSTCSATSTSTSTSTTPTPTPTPTKETKERRRASFVNTVTKTKNNPIFNSFRRKTAPEIDFSIISAYNNNNDKKKKNKKTPI